MLWSLFWPRRCPIVVGWLDFLISHQFEEKKVMDGLVFFFFFFHTICFWLSRIQRFMEAKPILTMDELTLFVCFFVQSFNSSLVKAE